jgi:predicted RNA-binding Zn-ribbon protein involved in translation (DUF1610 family)
MDDGILDDFDEFMEFDFVIGADVQECPSCNTKISCSLLFFDVVTCPYCGETFDR